MMAVEYII